jgi:hypothetical protein
VKTQRANRSTAAGAKKVARDREIARLHDVEMLTFGSIAKKLGLCEKTVRSGYHEYMDGIAPLFGAEDELVVAATFLRRLQGAQERYMAIHTDPSMSEATRLGALNRMLETMWREVAFRQIVGLLPRNLNDLNQLGEARYTMRHVSMLLERLHAPQWAYEYLLAAFRGEEAHLPETGAVEEAQEP